MNLFGIKLGRSPKPPPPPTPSGRKSFGGTPADWFRGEEPGAVFTSAYQQVAWVYRAINVLAEQVANIPFLFSVGERGRENLVTGGPLSQFYDRPHPQIDRFQYWELRIIWLMLRGECFRVPIFEHESPGQARRLSRVLILDPAHFQHLVEDHRLVGWRYTGFGPRAPLAAQVFLPEEIWFEKLPNPFDFWRGLPPLYAATTAARTDFAAAHFMRGIIENNADSGVIVRTDQPLDPEQQEQLFAALRERKRKAGTADRPMLLSGCSEVIRPQLSSTDLQFLENRKFSRAEICAAFGVPEEIVTSTDSAKYDVMRGARLNFIENRVAPLCGRLEAGEQVTVRSLDSKAVGWFDLDSLPILQEARRQRLVAARTGFDMGIPFNELNRVLDLGFTALPWGNTGYLSTRFQRLGEVAPGKRNTPSTPAAAADPGHWQQRLQLLFSASSESTAPDTEFKSRLRKLGRFLFEQRGRALAHFGAGTASSPLDSQVLPSASLPIERENEALAALVNPWLREDFCSAAQRVFAEASRHDLTVPPAAVQKFLAGQVGLVEAFNRDSAQPLLNRIERHGSAEASADSIRAIYNKLASHGAETFVSECRRAARSAGHAAGRALIARAERNPS